LYSYSYVVNVDIKTADAFSYFCNKKKDLGKKTLGTQERRGTQVTHEFSRKSMKLFK
jgi:hypothetical protein